jgi:hypothetical protein
MSDLFSDTQHRPRQRAGKQTLVVRQADERVQLEEVLERLAHLETLAESAAQTVKGVTEKQALKLDVRSIVAICAILLSITGYVVQDARNTSRQDAEIESTAVRLMNLEKITATNTEARVRSEVELDELRQGQAEIKELLRAKDLRTNNK